MNTEAGGAPVLSVQELAKHYPSGRGLGFGAPEAVVRAVDGVSFDLACGETLGVVGESGCGKSTLARTLLRLQPPTAGAAYFHGRNIFTAEPAELRDIRRRMQVIFQDPYASLNPRMRVDQLISEPWRIHTDFLPRAQWAERVAELLVSVGLRPEHAVRYPHEFSGGQRQRIGIARAMALAPEVIVCDEPVSALDVSVQAQVINLLEEIQQRLGVAYVFIAHDLSVVRHISDRVAVMYLGRIVEIGTRRAVYETPRHPYTRALLSAEPSLDFSGERRRKRIILEGEVPSPSNPPTGCSFRNRCWKAEAACAEAPELVCADRDPQHLVACHFPETTTSSAAG